MDYLQISFSNLQPEQKDILVAQLADGGFEGFEETETGLEAFIRKEIFDQSLLNEIAFKYQLSFTKNSLTDKNWNQIWESSFQPIIIDDYVAVRAGFHPPITGTQHEIIITPKMSFGTGHHATTSLMIEQMRDIDFTGKSVLDFGTGTGILAILAEKSGAASVTALDNDEWSISNATENLAMNNCTKTKILFSSRIPSRKKFDIILANITKNVILDKFPSFYKQLKIEGILVISGFLTDDKAEMLEIASKFNMPVQKILFRDNWLCLKLTN